MEANLGGADFRTSAEMMHDRIPSTKTVEFQFANKKLLIAPGHLAKDGCIGHSEPVERELSGTVRYIEQWGPKSLTESVMYGQGCEMSVVGVADEDVRADWFFLPSFSFEVAGKVVDMSGYYGVLNWNYDNKRGWRLLLAHFQTFDLVASPSQSLIR